MPRQPVFGTEPLVRCQRPAGGVSEPLLARQDIPPQAPVAHQAEARIFESGRLVVFEEKMTDPRKGIALNQRTGGEPTILSHDRGNQQREGDAGAGEVQAAGDAFACSLK